MNRIISEELWTKVCYALEVWKEDALHDYLYNAPKYGWLIEELEKLRNAPLATTLDMTEVTWANSGLLERSRSRFDELKHKQWDWSSFYNGFLEGSDSAFAFLRGLEVRIEDSPVRSVHSDVLADNPGRLEGNVQGLPEKTVADIQNAGQVGSNIAETEAILNRAINRLEVETAVKTAIVKWQIDEFGGEPKTGYDHIVDEVMKALRTTQPQPVHGVPSVEEIETVVGRFRTTWDNLHEISKAIHTMLLNRQEGK